MQIWFLCVGLLFILVELFQWLKGFLLPLPIYVLAGAFLAIASNYEKGIASLWHLPQSQPEATSLQTTNLSEKTPALVSNNLMVTNLKIEPETEKNPNKLE